MTQIFNQKDYKTLRQKLRKEIPRAEKILWSRIRRKQINNLRFFRQYSIENYIVDFYCPQINLVIEIDGDTHFTDEAVEKDKIRDERMKSLDLNVLRFNNNDIYYNIVNVMDRIYEVIHDLT